MKLKNIQAFTFVELIVVITIVAILATIGFTVYQSYLESSRDTNRVVQLGEISDGLDILSLKARLPLPEDMVSVEAGSGTVNTLAYQGFAGAGVMKAIGYTNGGKDPEFDIYPSYMLLENRKEFQLLAFIKDAKYLTDISQAQADIQYYKYFPKVEGKPLGILIEKDTQIPLQNIDAIKAVGKYNIMTGTGNFQSYISDTSVLSGNSGSLLGMIPNQNCKRILELGNSKGNGIYTISPDGVKKMQVYCDMTIDGGGWTLVARSVENTSYTGNFGWMYSAGNIYDDTLPYSMGESVKGISFSELLFAIYSNGKKIRPYNYTTDQATFGTVFSYTGTLYTAGKYGPFDKNLLFSGTPSISLVSDVIGGNWNDTNFMYSQPFLCPINNCRGGPFGNFGATDHYTFSPNTGGGTIGGLYKNKFNNYSVFNGKPGIFFIR